MSLGPLVEIVLGVGGMGTLRSIIARRCVIGEDMHYGRHFVRRRQYQKV